MILVAYTAYTATVFFPIISWTQLEGKITPFWKSLDGSYHDCSFVPEDREVLTVQNSQLIDVRFSL